MKGKIVWIIMGIFCMGLANNIWTAERLGTMGQVQAVGYNYPIEETKKTAELDENQRDEQGVYYTLDSEKHTAIVGSEETTYNTSQYAGANDGICIIPEKVSFDGDEYTVTKVGYGAFYRNEEIVALILSDTVKDIGERGFMETNIQYVYIGSEVDSIGNWAFKYDFLLIL